MEISGGADDALIEDLIDNATVYIENFCDRRFKRTSYTNEEYDGTGTAKLLLKNYPVDTSTTFTLQKRLTLQSDSGFDTVDSSFYHAKENGMVILTNGTFDEYPLHYRVTYTAGFNFDNVATYLSDTAASDLELACWKLVTQIYKNRRQSSNVKGESIGDYSVTYAREVAEDPFINGILHKYKRRVRM